MTFTVKYRAGDGKMHEECIEAASRSECVAKSKARGIAPISISENKVGINKSNKTRFKQQQKKVFFLSLVIIVFYLFYYVSHQLAFKLIIPQKYKSVVNTNLVNIANTPKTKIHTSVNTNTLASSPQKKYPTYVDDKGVIRYKNGMRVRVEEPARSFTVGGSSPKRFKYTSEEQIAGLLEITPGSMVFGRMSYGEKFVEDFKKSLTEDILFLETDSDYDKRLKEDVIATKKELKDALDRGEDIGEILTNTRRQLQELGIYRQKLKKQFEEFRRECPRTSEELKNFVDAVNVMLTESGARPIQLSRLLLRKIEQNGETK